MHRILPQASSHECDGKVPVSGRRRKRRYGVAVNPRYCCHSTPRQIAGTASICSAAALPVAWIVWSTTATILGFPFFASFPCNPNPHVPRPPCLSQVCTGVNAAHVYVNFLWDLLCPAACHLWYPEECRHVKVSVSGSVCVHAAYACSGAALVQSSSPRTPIPYATS